MVVWKAKTKFFDTMDAAVIFLAIPKIQERMSQNCTSADDIKKIVLECKRYVTPVNVLHDGITLEGWTEKAAACSQIADDFRAFVETAEDNKEGFYDYESDEYFFDSGDGEFRKICKDTKF